MKKSYKKFNKYHMHFLLAIDAPTSAYSSYVIHIYSNVGRLAKTLPPANTEYLRSSGAWICIFLPGGIRASNSFYNLSVYPLYIVLPPERTTLLYKSLLISISHF